MRIYSLLMLLFVLGACDAPVRTRVPTSTDYNNSFSGQEFNNNDNSSSYQYNTDDGNNNNSNNGSSNEPGFENCDLSIQFNGGNLGSFGMCQSSGDEKRFKAIFAQASTSGTCFVPVYIQGNGNSFKLGIAECVHNKANTTYYMNLNKEMMPPNFSYPRTEPINGVMVIGSASVNAYMGCMNAKEDYYVATYGCCYQKVPYNGRMYCLQPNPQCEMAANNYANNVCNSFVQNHSYNYRQVSF